MRVGWWYTPLSYLSGYYDVWFIQKNLIQPVKLAIVIGKAYAINVKQIVQFHNLTFFANNKVGG